MSDVKMVKTTILNKFGEVEIVETFPHFCHPISVMAKYVSLCKRCDEIMFRVPIGGPVGGAKWAHAIFDIDFNNRIRATGYTEHCHGKT